MDKLQLKEQVETIREAFGYINRFKGQTFVIKLGSSLLGHPLFPLLIRDIVLLHQMGIRIVLVPGAKERIDEVLQTYHIQCQTIDGVRISTPESIAFIKMAAFDVSNKVMTLLAENNVDAIIGNWVRARAIGIREGIDFQNSGMVEKLKTGIVQSVLNQGMLPIFPNIGWSATGKPYNISSNELAFTISKELGAAKLFFLTDFGGLRAERFAVPEGVYISTDGVVSQLTLDQAVKTQLAGGADRYDAQAELLSLACKACMEGVPRVHIISGHVEGMILKEIFSNRGLGTMIYANQHDNIRPMVHGDIPAVLALMQPSIDNGAILPRSAEDLERDADQFAVFEVDGMLHGSGALIVYPDKQAEIAAMAVDERYSNLGIGKRLVSYFLDRAARLKLKRVFALTTQAIDWFEQLGFSEAPVSSLPELRRQRYSTSRNSHAYAYALSGRKAKDRFRVE